ncbi:MAG: YdcF family protein [Candidatus Saccharibacteria bacterium]
MKIFAIIGVGLIIIIVGLSIYLQPNDFGLCPIDEKPITRDGCKAVDAIVAVSGGDTTARTNHAIDLYKNEWAPLLIFSGAAEDKSGPSNARAMYNIAIAAGVPPSDILIEENAANTKQNAENTNVLLTYKNIKSVILVTSGYHQRRASLEFHKLTKSSNVTIQNSPTNDKDWNFWWWLTPRGWWLAIGEFVKIIAFYTGASG